MFKRLLLSSAVLPLTLFHVTHAAAQEAAPPESADEEASRQGFTDIIVTARRVEENLQRVPTSVCRSLRRRSASSPISTT